MIARWGTMLPERGDLVATPRGIVLHWTGGGPKANATDLGAYHYIVEDDGNVRVGKNSVNANMRKLDAGDTYAAHTGGWNSFRVGLSAAGMKGYQGPAVVGEAPLTEVQVERLCELAAYFCDLAGLHPSDPIHLCTHREVWTLHRVKGMRNHLKRDIEFLPHVPHLGPAQVGDWLRQRAASYRQSSIPASEPPILGTRVYSPSLGWLYAAAYHTDDEWAFVTQRELEAALSRAYLTRAGTPLSKMPRKP